MQRKTKLDRQACMSIELWKDYSTSTDEERDAYRLRFLRRFHKVQSGELTANASVALNDYEVSAYMHTMLHPSNNFCTCLFFTVDLLLAALVSGDLW